MQQIFHAASVQLAPMDLWKPIESSSRGAAVYIHILTRRTPLNSLHELSEVS